MALFQRDCPQGIDAGIDILQKDLFIALVKSNWTDYDSYDRAYRNIRGSDKIPEVYKGKGEYKEVLINDNETVTSFFLTDEKRTYDYEKYLWEQNISIIFQANLSKLYPNIVHRADEEMINTIRLAIKSKYWDNRVTEIITGFEKVYDSLKLSYDKKDFTDMGQYSIVRFNFKMTYSNSEKIIFLK